MLKLGKFSDDISKIKLPALQGFSPTVDILTIKLLLHKKFKKLQLFLLSLNAFSLTIFIPLLRPDLRLPEHFPALHILHPRRTCLFTVSASTTSAGLKLPFWCVSLAITIATVIETRNTVDSDSLLVRAKVFILGITTDLVTTVVRR